MDGKVGNATVGALAVVNAVGDVVDVDGQVLAGSTAPADVSAFPVLQAFEATTLIVVATDARLTKVECHLLALSGHHGLARAVHPSHTRFDGDLVIALATGSIEADEEADEEADGTLDKTRVDRLRMAATDVVADAVRNAVRQT
jgi:L-aminopeptidase/D-esterase-like protein